MEHVAENLRFLLWREGVSRESWPTQLAGWIQGSPERAKELLVFGNLRPEEQAKIAQLTGCSEEDLQYTRLLEHAKSGRAINRVDILSQNVRFLIAELDHGKRKQLAESIRVTP